MSSALRTVLYDAHVAAGGRMVEFAGYDMPVQYDSVIAESKAVREGAGMFDVSHMARLIFKGERVLEFLEHITTNDVSKLVDGQGQYSILPNFEGGAVDDIIVYRLEATKFAMVVNASNHAKDVAWMKAQNTFGVEITDETELTSMIAVQGPRAVDLLAEHSDAFDQFNSAVAFGIVEAAIEGIPVFAARSGYTGEDGYELIVNNEHAVALWDTLVDLGVKPCGLGARDVLRVEAGLPLYGHELGDDMSPIAAGLGWVVSKTKAFIGLEHYNAARANGTATKLQGVRLSSKRLIAPGMKVFVDGEEVGEVSSGVFSPLLDCGIAFVFIDSAIALGTPCEIEVRGKMEPGTVVSKRFYKRA
ncbi:MAG: glycine cleavage system aminomethyltransferase GcvT [Armatimonadetes bacterium]|nr:glycine cleavage system aminomethyltransferase GcvT [Armatimonadota bacterium]